MRNDKTDYKKYTTFVYTLNYSLIVSEESHGTQLAYSNATY